MYLVRVIPARGPDAGGAYGTAISLRGTGLSGPLLPVRDSTRTRAPRSSRVAPGQLYGPPLLGRARPEPGERSGVPHGHALLAREQEQPISSLACMWTSSPDTVKVTTVCPWPH